MTHVSLFTGIGGIDIAAEWAGFKTIAQVERDPYCLKILERHWPDVHRCREIRDFPDRDYGAVTLVSGGPPCQPHSLQGQRRGEKDSRFLWPEMYRVVVATRPRWILVENVFGVLSDNLADSIINDLEAASYNVAPPLVFPAYAYGADFCGERVFFVAAANGILGEKRIRNIEIVKGQISERYLSKGMENGMDPNSGVDRAAHGIPHRMDRLKCLGNAVVPRQVYPILQAIAEVERESI